jgi:amino acid transporter
LYVFSSVASNFAFSFAIISVLTGVTTTYNTGLRYGGPASMTLGWLVVALFNGCVALSMAEICSAYPTSGGLYYWSAKLAGKEWAPLASWVTGWLVTFSFSSHFFLYNNQIYY